MIRVTSLGKLRLCSEFLLGALVYASFMMSEEKVNNKACQEIIPGLMGSDAVIDEVCLSLHAPYVS